MLFIRRFEEKIIEVYPRQDMKSPVHLYIGQEAIAAGFCAHLESSDYLFTTHRSHGPCLAKGADPYALYAEFYGRRDGCCRGKGGSMHLCAPEVGVLGTSAIVGGGIPLAAGAALAAKRLGRKLIVASFFGDGATEEGAFHETLNFASLHRLPVVFVCENNFYATNSPLHKRQPHSEIFRYAQAYNLPGVQVDGNDVEAVYLAAADAVARARRGEGPTLVECLTYRWKGHVGPDCDWMNGCRPQQELDKWMRRCPVESCRLRLLEGGLATQDEMKVWEEAIDTRLEDALSRAQASPFPAPEELLQHVYHTAD